MKKRILFGCMLWTLSLALYSQNGVKIDLFNTGTAFTCIAMDTNNNVWAGTTKLGLYFLGKKANATLNTFSLVPVSGTMDLAKDGIQALAADKIGNLWVGHNGAGGSTAVGGGVEKIDINNTGNNTHFTSSWDNDCPTKVKGDGLGTLNCMSIAMDKYNTVWTAQKYNDENSGSYVLTPGSLSYKVTNSKVFHTKSTWQDLLGSNEDPNLPYPAYTCNIPANKSAGSRTCNAVACGKSTVWFSVYSYEYATSRNIITLSAINTAVLPARILVYDLGGAFQKQITFASLGATPGGVFNAIYVAKNENAWIGLSASKGFAACIKGCWTLLNSTNLPTIFPNGATVNGNAIWGNDAGQVFIGTNQGLIVYDGVGKVNDATSYSIYTVASSAISSNTILGGANENDSIQWVATDNGITRIKSLNKFSIEPNYTLCNNQGINAIEAQAQHDLSQRSDFHSYIIETVVCDGTSPNGSNCNAQYVYNMMKSDPAYQAPSITVWPYDNMKMSLLINLSDEEKKEVVANVNAWTKSANGNEFGGIKYIRQVLSNTMILKYYCGSTPTMLLACFGDGRIPFGEKFLHLSSRVDYGQRQTAENPLPPIQNCSEYKLYNSPNIIVDRALYRNTFNLLFCGFQLESIEYDKVRIFADDKNLTITNYTEAGHILHPGKVVRYITEECGKVKVITVGSGLNYCAETQIPSVITEEQRVLFNLEWGPVYGNINNIVLSAGERKIFGAVARLSAKMNGNGNIVVGSILFKNIDLKLIKAFEAGH
jgi:hypothetical protein